MLMHCRRILAGNLRPEHLSELVGLRLEFSVNKPLARRRSLPLDKPGASSEIIAGQPHQKSAKSIFENPSFEEATWS
ncbi:hypothetical protein BJL95_03875 [Methylomonas sp. LWB]|nr:hypothetical protein BJL95_03875 [Methylomonas sp. LWB]